MSPSLLTRRLKQLYRYWFKPIIPLSKLVRAPWAYQRFIADFSSYRSLSQHEALHLRDARPMLFDRTTNTPFDAHYFYQGIWLFQQVQQTNPQIHIDVGSLVQYGGFLSQITNVVFLDIRPVKVQLYNYTSMNGNLLELPFATESIKSISCLHVAEHIGLGRYGDPLDPHGTINAASELARVLAKGGNLYFSLPIGKPKVQFNAHRIHSPDQILTYFNNLELVSFSAVDQNEYIKQANPTEFSQSQYACGMFHFRK